MFVGKDLQANPFANTPETTLANKEVRFILKKRNNIEFKKQGFFYFYFIYFFLENQKFFQKLSEEGGISPELF